MNYPIPDSLDGIEALRNRPVNDDVVATAIAGVISIARSQGQSLADVTAQVLADDSLLEPSVRQVLSEIMAQAWDSVP